VTAPAVGVSVPAGGGVALQQLVLERGATLPAGVPAETIKRLSGKGMITQPDPEPAKRPGRKV
jgi:hypothetical protein